MRSPRNSSIVVFGAVGSALLLTNSASACCRTYPSWFSAIAKKASVVDLVTSSKTVLALISKLEFGSLKSVVAASKTEALLSLLKVERAEALTSTSLLSGSLLKLVTVVSSRSTLACLFSSLLKNARAASLTPASLLTGLLSKTVTALSSIFVLTSLFSSLLKNAKADSLTPASLLAGLLSKTVTVLFSIFVLASLFSSLLKNATAASLTPASLLAGLSSKSLAASARIARITN